MRRLIAALDALLRRTQDVFEFSQASDCILRLGLKRVAYPLRLPAGEVPAGSAVLELHLWNERVPPIPPQGPDVAWAWLSSHRLLESLRMVAVWMQTDSRAAGVRAVGGVTAILSLGADESGERFFRRLGFDIFPHPRPLGRFGEFWENLYSWWLMWAFNSASLRRRHLLNLRRADIWMTAGEFLRRFSESSARG